LSVCPHLPSFTRGNSKVGGPPLLGVCHEGMQFLFQGIVVETLEGCCVIKVVQRVAGRLLLAQDFQFQIIRTIGISSLVTSPVSPAERIATRSARAKRIQVRWDICETEIFCSSGFAGFSWDSFEGRVIEKEGMPPPRTLALGPRSSLLVLYPTQAQRFAPFQFCQSRNCPVHHNSFSPVDVAIVNTPG
jgi:hypothetical protein